MSNYFVITIVRVFKKASFQSVVLLLLLLSCGQSFAAGAHLQERFSDVSGIDADVSLVGMTADENWYLYEVVNGTLDDSIELDHNPTLLLINSNGEKRLINVDEQNQLRTGPVRHSRIHQQQNKILFTYSNDIDGESSANAYLHIYDIDSDSLVSYATPDSIFTEDFYYWRDPSMFSQENLVYFALEGQLWTFDMVQEIWLDITPEGLYDCQSRHSASLRINKQTEDGRLIVEKSCSDTFQIYAFDPNSHEFALLLEPGEHYYSLRTGPEVSKLGFKHSFTSDIILYDIEASAQSSIESNQGWLLNKNVVAISPDGRFLVADMNPAIITPSMQKDQYEKLSSAKAVLDLETGEQAVVTLEPQRQNDAFWFGGFYIEGFGSNGQLIAGHMRDDRLYYQQAGVATLSLNTLFPGEAVEPITDISIISGGPFRATHTFDYSDTFIKVKRRRQGTSEPLQFVLHGGETFEDFRYGLTPGVYEYQFVPCDKNWRCEESLTQQQLFDVEDTDAITFDLQPLDDNDTTSQVLVTVQNPIADMSLSIFGRSAPQYEVQPDQSTFEFVYDISERDSIFNVHLRYCLSNHSLSKHVFDHMATNHLLEEESCNNYSQPKFGLVPQAAGMTIKPFSDLSGLSIEWQAQAEFNYHLYRSTLGSDEEILLAENISEGRFSDQVDADSIYQYRLTICSVDICTNHVSNPQSLQLPNDAGTLTYLEGSEFGVETHVAYEELYLQRRASYSEEEFESIALISARQRYIEDETATPELDYDYQLRGCTAGQCESVSVVRNVVFPAVLDAFGQSDAPPAVENLTATERFLGIRLNWDINGDYDGILIEKLVNRQWQSESLLYQPKDNFWESHVEARTVTTAYRVRSFWLKDKQDTSSEKVFSDSRTVAVEVFDTLASPVDNDLKVNFDLESDGLLTLSWRNDRGSDIYHVYERAVGSDEFELLTTLSRPSSSQWSYYPRYTNAQYYGSRYFITLARELNVGDETAFYFQACSYITNTCDPTPYVNHLVVERSNYGDINFGRAAPTISLDEDVIAVQANGIYHTELDYFGLYNSQREEIAKQRFSPYFELPIDNYTPGETLSFRTNYCPKDQVCSGLSQTGRFTLPDTSQVTPSIPDRIDRELTRREDVVDISWTLAVTQNFWRTSELIVIYLADEQGQLQQHSEFDVSSSEVNIALTDLPLQETYSFYIQGCNSNVCSDLESLDHFYTPQNNPPPPDLRYVEREADSNRFVLEVGALNVPGFAEYAVSHEEIAANADIQTQVVRVSQSRAEQRFTVEGLPGDTLYVAVRTCVTENNCGDFSENEEIEVTSQDNIDDAGFQVNSEDYLSGNQEVLFHDNGFVDNGDGLARYRGAISTNNRHYLGDGFSLEYLVKFENQNYNQILHQYFYNTQPHIDYFNFYDWYDLPSRLFSITTESNNEGESLLFNSPYWDNEVSLDATLIDQWGKINLTVDNDGNLSLHINDELVSQSDKQLNMVYYQYSRLVVDVHGSGIARWELNTQNTPVPFAFDGIAEQRFVDSVINHPEYLRIETLLPIDDFTHHIWTYDNETPVLHASGNNQQLQEHLSSVRELFEYASRPPIAVQLCLEDICGAMQYFDIIIAGWEDIRSWPFDIRVADESSLLNYSFTVDYGERGGLGFGPHVQTFEVIELDTETQEETVIAQYSYLDLLAEMDSNFEFAATHELPIGINLNYGLRVCTPIECVLNYHQQAVFLPQDNFTDSDGDGVTDGDDAFPNDPTEWLDTDNDGIGDNSDPDIDGDGVLNEDDVFPADSTEWSDLDGDGIGDNSDTDIDGDGIPNDEDRYPYAASGVDTDGDGLTDTTEFRIGYDSLTANDLSVDADQDGYLDIIEALAGVRTDDINDTPDSNGYFESFENSHSELLRIGASTQFGPEGATHGIQAGNWIVSQDTAGIPDTLRYTGHLETGYIMFTTTTAQGIENQDNLVTYSLLLNDREIDINEQEQFQVPLSDTTILHFIRVGHGDGTVVRITMDMFIPVTTSFDSFYFPGGGACELAGNNTVNMDFNCDGKADPVVGLPFSNNFVYKNLTSNISVKQSAPTDEFNSLGYPLAGDFDGDGVSEVAWRDANSFDWFIDYSGTPNGVPTFGKKEEDIPVPADYDGDGITDIAVRRPSNSMWYILRSSDGEIDRIRFGLRSEDIPVPGDYDGDGKADVAVRRDSNKHWYIRNSSDGEIQRIHFGKWDGDIAVPADYDGDGITDVAIRRPDSFEWFIRRSSDLQTQSVTFGRRSNDIPVVADYDGDGKADIAVRRVENFTWYILRSSDNQIQRERFALDAEYIPLAAPIMIRQQMAQRDLSFIFP